MILHNNVNDGEMVKSVCLKARTPGEGEKKPNQTKPKRRHWIYTVEIRGLGGWTSAAVGAKKAIEQFFVNIQFFFF